MVGIDVVIISYNKNSIRAYELQSIITYQSNQSSMKLKTITIKDFPIFSRCKCSLGEHYSMTELNLTCEQLL